MCVYRGMDIGTSKPGPEARAAVPHHLLDLVDPDEDFTVTAVPAGGTRRRWPASTPRGHHALLVGGTGLYLRAVVDDLVDPGPLPRGGRRAGGRAGRGPGRAGRPARPPGRPRPGGGGARWSRPTGGGSCAALEVTLGCGAALLRRSGPGSRRTRPAGIRQVGLARPPDEVDRRIEARFARHGGGRPASTRCGRWPRARRDLAHGPPGARLPRDPGPRGGGRAPGRLRGGGGAAHPPVRPPPGLVVPPGPADRPGPPSAAEAQELLEQALGRARLSGASLREWCGARHQARGRGQRLPGRPRPRRRHPVLGGPGAPAGRPAPGHRGRRDHPGRAGPRRLRPLHGAAQRRRRRGRDERQRDPLPGPGRGRRRPGVTARASRWPRPAAAARSSTRRARRPGGRRPASTWARPGSGPTSPRSSTTAGPGRSTSGNPHLVLLGPDTAERRHRRARAQAPGRLPGGINVEWITVGRDDEGELLDFRVWERGVGETLACGTGSVAAAAAARSWGAVRGRRHRAGAQPRRDPRGHARARTRRRPRYLAGPVRKVADIDIHPGMLS